MTSTVASNVPQPMLEIMKRHTLTAELPRPGDVANAVVFLSSDRAAFVTGIALPIDGGFSVHSPSFADEMAFFNAASGVDTAARVASFERLFATQLQDQGPAALSLFEELATDVAVWHGASADDVRGPGEIGARWSRYEAAEVAGVYADGTHVVGVMNVGANGHSIKQATVVHLDAAGKAATLWTLPSDDDVAAALSSGGPLREHPRLARFRAAEEARARGTFAGEDLRVIEDFLCEDVHWRSPWGPGPSSREEVVQQFKTFNESTGGSMRFVLGDVFADDSHALSLVRLVAERPDQPDRRLDVGEANVFHLDREGRAYEFWGIAEDQAAINDFWAG
jgi:hypothetical protein